VLCGTLFAVRIVVDYRPALRERTGVGEYVHELAKALSAPADEPRDEITLFTNSWKDRPAPSLASEMPSARIVDLKIPVSALVWSWNRMEWPPIEWFSGPADVVHSQSPLLIPSGAAQVVTVHDLDFLRHPIRWTPRFVATTRRWRGRMPRARMRSWCRRNTPPAKCRVSFNSIPPAFTFALRDLLRGRTRYEGGAPLGFTPGTFCSSAR